MRETSKRIRLLLSASFLFTSCSSKTGSESDSIKSSPSNTIPSVTPNAPSSHLEKFPESLTEIPSDYYTPIQNQGELRDFYYSTYESFSYDSKSTPLRKHAVVYLPFGYN